MSYKPKIENFTRLSYGLSFKFLDSMEDLVRIRDSNGEILFENKNMREIIREEIFKNKSVSVSKIFLEFFEDIKKTKDVFKREVILANKTYEVNASPILDKNNQINGYIEVFRDVTQERNITRQLYNTNKNINDDIVLAKSIQKSILPSRKRYGNIKFQYGHVPSNDLSGDVFDVIEISENKIGVYIADVVGHGISSSILTMFIRQSMRRIVEENKDISCSDTIRELKRMFSQLELDISQYFTIIYTVFDLNTNTMTYVNAGHNCYPILFDSANIGFLQNSGKFISNLFEDSEYKEKELKFNEGDKLLLYTDGLVETMDAEGNFFGEEKLVNWIRKNRGSKNLVRKLLNDLEIYRWKEQKDDISIVYIEIKGEDDEN